MNSELILSPAEAFQLCVKASEAFRAGADDSGVYFYVDHYQVVADVGIYLPVENDRTLETYAKRVSRHLAGRKFALVIQDIQAFGDPLWLRLRRFLETARGCVSLGQVGAKATLFMGDYAATPFGIHRGNSDVIKFVILGQKELRLWTDEHVRSRGGVQHSLDEARLGHSRIVLNGKAGDVLYWPANHWHVGRCVGGLAVSLSLAIFQRRSSQINDFAQQAANIATDFHLLNPRQQVATGVADAKRKLSEAIIHPAVLTAATAESLNRISSSGFRTVPPPLETEVLMGGAWVQGSRSLPVLTARGAPGEIICSANGHAFTVTRHPAVKSLLIHLNRGTPCRISALVDAYADSAGASANNSQLTPKHLHELLAKLHSLRAIKVVPEPPVKSMKTKQTNTQKTKPVIPMKDLKPKRDAKGGRAVIEDPEGTLIP